MTDWIVVAGVVWMLLVGAVIFLALCRISTAMEEEKLTHAGWSESSALHVQLAHVIQSEDRTGIALTAAAFICSVVLAFMLANQILPGGIHRLVQILILSLQ
jgi:hypothetical protein